MKATCSVCKEEKALSEFNKNKTRKNGHSHICRDCDKKAKQGTTYSDRNKAYAARNPDKIKLIGRASHLRNKYNLTIEEFDELRIAQNHRCFICGTHETETHREVLCVDHDHDTGSIRKLLCSKCNQGLGLFNDSSSLLKKAAEYLESYGKS